MTATDASRASRSARERSAMDDARWMVGDWLVLAATHRLERAGTSIAVEPRMMAVLTELSRQPGEVFSADSLLQGTSCSVTTIQAASRWRISSSCPTQRTGSSSGCARCRVTPSIATVIDFFNCSVARIVYALQNQAVRRVSDRITGKNRHLALRTPVCDAPGTSWISTNSTLSSKSYA